MKEVFNFLKIAVCYEFSNKAILSSSTGDKSGDWLLVWP